MLTTWRSKIKSKNDDPNALNSANIKFFLRVWTTTLLDILLLQDNLCFWFLPLCNQHILITLWWVKRRDKLWSQHFKRRDSIMQPSHLKKTFFVSPFSCVRLLWYEFTTFSSLKKLLIEKVLFGDKKRVNSRSDRRKRLS